MHQEGKKKKSMINIWCGIPVNWRVFQVTIPWSWLEIMQIMCKNALQVNSGHFEELKVWNIFSFPNSKNKQINKNNK